MRKRVVYLLGAGAMIDFNGPATSELTLLCSNLLKKYYCDKILSELESTYGERMYNFETIIAAVENLLDWTIAHERLGAINVQNTNVISSIFCNKFQNLSSEEYLKIYQDLINSIIDRTKKYDYEIVYNQKHQTLKRFFEQKVNNETTKIYSLNYDRLIPRLLKNVIYDGTNLPLYGGFNYNLKGFICSEKTYFNLHGSIYLNMEYVRDLLSYKVVQHSIPQYLTYALEQEGGAPNDVKLFSPIIAGYSKSQRMLSEPFSFGLSAFMADCNLCDELVVIGYSFSDPHINSIIRNFIQIGSKTMIIVDKKDWQEIEKVLTTEFKVVFPFHENKTGAYNEQYKIQISSKGFLEYMT